MKNLYNYVWEIAETVRGRSAEEFKAEMGKDASNMEGHDFRIKQNIPYGNHISGG